MRKYIVVISEDGVEVERRTLYVGCLRLVRAADGTPQIVHERKTATEDPRPSEC